MILPDFGPRLLDIWLRLWLRLLDIGLRLGPKLLKYVSCSVSCSRYATAIDVFDFFSLFLSLPLPCLFLFPCSFLFFPFLLFFNPFVFISIGTYNQEKC